ncbi:ROK family transcriptional regulator [Motilibacter aurantiacus]|uniref:ROK family transcriptional regulator n=1 Tax=Motilibacter aurantiacus TaxID=2714955 RepID=UPI00140DB32D|nr:ROK family transcriptional regulator [Motilibacter aurantiacus]NHC46280.1 ROK family transcriptional regulator [Motilibacter aurantiacus]
MSDIRAASWPAPRRSRRAPGPARQSAMREHNLALALREIAFAPTPVSRADIAGATGLTRATASSLVDALVGAGLVVESGPTARARGGRPATGLVLSEAGPAGVGIEVNVDYVAVCVMDLSGVVRSRHIEAGDWRDEPAPAVLGRTARIVAQVAAESERAGLRLAGAALAVPGLVRAPYGPLQLAPNLGWHDLDVLEVLRAAPDLPAMPLTVDNEANFAALAELFATPAEAGASVPRSFLHVSGEIGIGSGIVLDGALVRGRHGWSGELGHLTVSPDGPDCTCGARGCLEQYAGLDAILRAAGLPASRGTSLGGVPAVDRIVEAARAADPRMLAALESAGTALGVALAGALNLLDLDAVVLGGAYAPLSPWILRFVQQEVSGRLLSAPWSAPHVRASRLEADAAVLGAARSVVQGVVDDPAAWVARVGA